MLRGPQTLGEIRGRAERLYAFEGLDEVSATLQGLMEREGGPMVARLPRRTGYKEARYAHLFSGEVQEDEADTEVSEPADPQVPKEDDRISKLEAEMAAFRQELDELRRHFAEFRKQFE